MRPSWLMLSLSLHAAAAGAALTAGLWAVRAAERRPAQVEIQPSQAAPPPSVPAPAPQVVREAATVVVEAQLREPTVVEPIAEPEPAAERSLPDEAPAPREVAWPRLAIRKPAAAPAVSAALEAAPSEVVPAVTPSRTELPSSEASAEVRATPRADNPAPVYPADERAKGREGDVLVRAFVDEFGIVQSAELAQPSPYAGFNREALRAVRGWRFVPARRSGAAVAGLADVLVEFRLTGR